MTFTAEPPAALIKRLKEEPGGDIWICGGATIAQELLLADAIDCLRISIMPTLLGAGIPLFGTAARLLTLTEISHANGIAELCYRRRDS